MRAGLRAMDSSWRSRSSILLAPASWLHSTGDCRALSCWLERLRRTQLEIEELYPAGSSVFAALNWRSRSSILLTQTSMVCTQLEIEELYPAGSNVNGLHSTGDRGALSCWLKRQWTALDWRLRSSTGWLKPPQHSWLHPAHVEGE